MNNLYEANSELEKALKNDTDGTYKAGLIETFNNERGRIREELKKGLMPEDYSALNSFLVALGEAIYIVEKVSKKLQ